jgi:hypothetical protein
VSKDRKAEAIHNFYDGIMGTPPNHACTICLEHLDIPWVELSALSDRFTEAEVWSVIKSWPPDKTSGPDGFSARFLQAAWHIIHPDLMRAFDAFWWLDMRNIHDVNGALMVLLPNSSKDEFEGLSVNLTHPYCGEAYLQSPVQ